MTEAKAGNEFPAQALEAQLGAWQAEIERLRAIAKQARGQTQVDYFTHINNLEYRKRGVEIKLQEFHQAHEQHHARLQRELNYCVESFQEALRSALTEMDEPLTSDLTT